LLLDQQLVVFGGVSMSISGLGQSYLALLNGAKTQQKTGASVTIMDTQIAVHP